VNADIHVLTGAYACDALDPDEQTDFERHLAHCEACAQEVTELRSTAAALGLAAASEPPAELHERVMRQIAVTRQQPPVVTSLAEARAKRSARDRGWWVKPTGWIAAAALVVGVAVLGAVVKRQDTQIGRLRGQTSAMTQLLAAGDARSVTGPVSTGGTATVVLSASDNHMLFTAAGLPALPAGKAYQLWMIDAAGVRPGPVLKPVDGTVSPIVTAGLDGARTIAMTVEPASGSTKPTTTPILTLTAGA
jgi:anti-sigma factor RsiW